MIHVQRQLIWALAKHRAGLERPQFLGYSRPRTPVGRSSPVCEGRSKIALLPASDIYTKEEHMPVVNKRPKSWSANINLRILNWIAQRSRASRLLKATPRGASRGLVA